VTPAAAGTHDKSDIGPQRFETVSSFESHLDYLVQLCRQDGRAVVLATQANVYTRSGGMAADQPPHTMRSQLFKSPGSGRISPQSLAVGMSAMRGIGSKVGADAPICVIDARNDDDARAAASQVLAAVEIAPAKPDPAPVIHRRIGADDV
ncbi:MAG: hypothetical protein IID55_12300, partial [Proteobacteria bacterium]|nr:hypothetical protein [Pseudomonadota bacterium]